MSTQIKEIIPNPLINSIVELRFSSTLTQDEVLGEFYGIFGAKFPKVVTKNLPKEIKKLSPDLKYSADYVIRNEEYSISFGNNVIAFENVSGYKLWDNYFKMLKENLSLLKNNSKIDSLIRIGVRYASVFETNKSLDETVNLDLKINFDEFKQENEFFRVNLKKDDIVLHLQVIQNAKVKKDNIEKKGLYIDIDASQSNNLPKKNRR